MPRYVVRMDCELSLVVEAKSADAALTVAKGVPVAQWDASYGDEEVDDEEAP